MVRKKSRKTKNQKHAPLHLKSFALAAGVSWAVGLFLLAVGVIMFNWGTLWMQLLQSTYMGYDTTPMGILAGMIWGFLDMAIGAAIFVWLYNWFLDREN
jgi:hypothetical protein